MEIVGKRGSQKMMKKSIHVEATSFTHRLLWLTANNLVVSAKNLSDKQWTLYMAALVMTFFTLESYLNYLGETVDPDTWTNERDFFRMKPYIGTIGKLYYLADYCGLKPFERGKRPFQTIKQLSRLRDFLAHGRSERNCNNVRVIPGKFPPYIKSFLEKSISEKKAEIALNDVEGVINEIHKAALFKFPHSGLFADPFSGILGSQISDTIRLEKKGRNNYYQVDNRE